MCLLFSGASLHGYQKVIGLLRRVKKAYLLRILGEKKKGPTAIQKGRKEIVWKRKY